MNYISFLAYTIPSFLNKFFKDLSDLFLPRPGSTQGRI